MNTETTETFRGWVCYDAHCAFCQRWAWRTDELLARRGWHLAPLQAGWVRLALGMKEGAPLVEMKLLTADGQIFGGAAAIIEISRSIWWAWPFFALPQIPGIKPVLRSIYRCIANHRYCLGGQCAMPVKPAKRHRHLTSTFYEFP